MELITKVESRRNTKRALAIGVASGLGTAILTFFALAYGLATRYGAITELYPIQSRVQQGFADPRKVKLRFPDLDHNGETESYFIYDGRVYELSIDRNNIPSIGNQR